MFSFFFLSLVIFIDANNVFQFSERTVIENQIIENCLENFTTNTLNYFMNTINILENSIYKDRTEQYLAERALFDRYNLHMIKELEKMLEIFKNNYEEDIKTLLEYGHLHRDENINIAISNFIFDIIVSFITLIMLLIVFE